MKTSKILISVAGVIIFMFLSAFTTSLKAENGKIEGKVKNSLTSKPVDFAAVVLYHLPDSAVVKGLNTDTAGYFIINNLPYGQYCLKVSFLGYKPVKHDNIVLNVKQSAYNTGTINMEENVNAIEEVSVTGERLKGTTEVDKTVYVISEKAALSVNSGLELLRKVPAVQVDFQNNVSLEGSGNILVFVDGKQRDKDFLAQLDPKSIEKVEVMTNPSVKYDADVSGVINIILKKEKKHGVSSRIEGEIPVTKNLFSNSSANIEYGYNRIRAFASGQMHFESYNINSYIYRKSTSGTQTTEYKQNGDGSGSWLHLGINYGIDWFIDDKNTLNFYGNCRPGNGGKFDVDYDKELVENHITSSFLTSLTKENNENNSQYYSLFYRRTFNEPSQELTVDLNYNLFNGNQDRHYTEQYYLTDKITSLDDPSERYEFVKNNKDAAGLKIDYTHPINKSIKLNTGYHSYSQWIDNRFTNGFDSEDNRFRYNENRHSFYGNLSGKIKDFTWQGGLRYEMSYIDIKQNTKIDYTCLLPQVSLQQKLSKTQSLKLNYRRSIARPGINDLNPFVNYSDSLTVSYGNPNLDPAYNNKVELNYNVQFNGNFLSPGVYYNYFNNNFQRVTLINSEGISETYIDNIGKGMEYGFTLSGSVKLAKWWQINPYFCVFAKELKEIEKYNIGGADKISWRGNLSMDFTLPKKFTFSTFAYYNSPYINTQTLNKRTPIYVASIEKEILKDGKGKISFLAINPFMKNFVAQHTITESDNLYQEQKLNIKINGIYTVRFTLLFSSGQKIKKLDRQKDIENEGARSVL